MVLEKDGEDWFDLLCEECGHSQRGEEYPTYNKRRNASWIGHILHRKWLLKHVIQAITWRERSNGKMKKNT